MLCKMRLTQRCPLLVLCSNVPPRAAECNTHRKGSEGNNARKPVYRHILGVRVHGGNSLSGSNDFSRPKYFRTACEVHVNLVQIFRW